MERVRGQAQCRGPEPEWTEDDPPDAVRALLRAAGSAAGGAVVTVAEDGTSSRRSYPELLDAARRLAAGLRATGTRPGDPVVLCGLPLDEFFPAFWGCVLAGALPAAIADRPTPGSPALERLRHVHRQLGGPLVLGGGPPPAGGASLPGADPLARAVPGPRLVPARALLDAADPTAPTDRAGHGGEPTPRPSDTALLDRKSTRLNSSH